MRYKDLPLKEAVELQGSVDHVEVISESRVIVHLDSGHVLMVDALLQEG